MPSTSLLPASSAKVAKLSWAALALLALPAAHADLLSSEPFWDYNTGALQNTRPSPIVSGYTGDWTAVDYGNAQPAITSGSLTYGDARYFESTGDKVSVPHTNTRAENNAENSGRVYRLLDSTLAVTHSTTGTLYLSFLFQSGQQTGATLYQTLALYNGPVLNGVDSNRAFDAGLTTNDGSGTRYTFGGGNAYTGTGVAADTAVHLFVVKFDLGNAPGQDSVTVWVDPPLDAGEPATGGTTVVGKNLTFDRLVLSDYDANSAAWDEIRWGTSFDAVTVSGVPEPSTYAAAAR